ncbi:xaa-Pro aminopeptidase 1 [Pectinophora gossypiella]|uniref:xaa-Pro aminopeptidase 1 n=1 Tax=Pectinophora gossypiella TaxID=13191 RepID=UPI00214F5176|nr:xaa-Pro aminopeptidase 1 [Pectinophora gossypiella]XP_049869628.1 xaa-Pro aminopeptidase 1 [Pectinophora gossypiella]XP_049869630.1 xaa-Pro aminopeptidase 1 [Pectinophora gossypiella]XP_049869631.1 xaa-Pro aminopeptidase 1 [Pectinophora gossypiella]
MKMGDLKLCLFIALVFVAACSGARNSKLLAAQTTTTMPPSPPPTVRTNIMVATRQSSTQPMQLATLPPPCPEATSTVSPPGRLRAAMKNTSFTQMNAFFDAFLVFFSDEHLSEEPAPEERRLEYISGWDGAGTAAVLAEGGAALWVPSGDVTRAKDTVSCAWIVLDADDPSQPTVAEWVADRIGRAGRVGGDARLTSVLEWQGISTVLQRSGLTLVHVPTLLDQLWAEEPDPARRRPDFSRIVANLHHMEYTGLQWREKVALLRRDINMSGAEAMIVTALDEVAWLLNVRGKDVPTAPLLKAFVIVSLTDVRVYAPPGKLSMPVREALSVYNCYPNSNNNNCTRVNEYTTIYSDLRRLTESKVLIPTAGTFQRGASAAIAMAVPQPKRMYQPSPIIYLKAQKNEAEVKGMHRAHLRDAVAMCTLLSYMEGMMKTGLTELSVAMKVDVTRATQAGYVGVSMATRVAFGPSGAEPDYRATNSTKNRRVFTNSTLVIRSGGQYDEGTTVVTRTLHYGAPTHQMRTAYTTVLRSLAAMSTLQMPSALPAAHIDPVARAPLWAAKQDYPHPTGHGVGAALNRREDPVVIDYRQDTNLHNFREGYFITSEPAWYERAKFGVRLGNVLEVVLRPDGYLGFTEATLLPFEPKLIDKKQLTEYEMKWINAYNDRIRKIVGPELQSQGLLDVYYWMTNKTVHIEPMKMNKPANHGHISVVSWSLVVGVVVFSVFA